MPGPKTCSIRLFDMNSRELALPEKILTHQGPTKNVPTVPVYTEPDIAEETIP